MSESKKLTLAPRIISLTMQQEKSNEALKPRVVSSKDLIGECKSLTIEHEGEIYHLRATKFGKLVLTK